MSTNVMIDFTTVIPLSSVQTPLVHIHALSNTIHSRFAMLVLTIAMLLLLAHLCSMRITTITNAFVAAGIKATDVAASILMNVDLAIITVLHISSA